MSHISHKKIDGCPLNFFHTDQIIDQLLSEFSADKPLNLFLYHVWERTIDDNPEQWINTITSLIKQIKIKCPDWQVFLILNSWFRQIDLSSIDNKIILYVDFFAYRTWNELVNKHKSPIAYRWANNQEKFLFLTGQPTAQNRTRLLYKFSMANMLSCCCWSYHYADDMRDQDRSMLRSLIPELSAKEFNNFLITHRNNPDNIVSDFKDKKIFNYNGIPYDINLYTNSLFSVVPETGFRNTSLPWVTEKIYKAIINQHPFIIAGDTNTLDLLQRYGFITFENCLPITNYADIEDPEQRLDAIVSNTQYWLKNINQHADQITDYTKHNLLVLKKIYDCNVKLINNFIQENTLNMSIDQLMPTDRCFPNLMPAINSFHLHTDSDSRFCTFYNNVKDPSWPAVDSESDYNQLPDPIKEELCKTFGYVPLQTLSNNHL